MAHRSQEELANAQWQAEADLLADGRELLERLTRSLRYRHLYPEGPNVAVLLEAYRDLVRLRTVGRVRAHKLRPQRRALANLIREGLRRDAIERTHRLTWRYPLPRLDRLPGIDEATRAALGRVDADVRSDVTDAITGHRPTEHVDPAASHVGQIRLERGLSQFRTALINEALAHPRSIAALHPQMLQLIASGQPRRRQRPLVTFALVKLPLYLWMFVILLAGVSYGAAFVLFNGEVLGTFVSDKVSGILNGDLRMRSIYWRPRLIVDLVTGQPTPLVVKGVTVYEPYKSVVDSRQVKAAEAEELEVSLVLHEIIPWNLLGVPQVFEIPWVLHFAEVRGSEPVYLNVRQYVTSTEDGQQVELLGLRDAFQLYNFTPRIVGPGLSIYVDDAVLERAQLTLDFTDTSIWGVATTLRDVRMGLWFDSPDSRLAPPELLPFRFSVSAEAPRGVLAIREYQFALSDWTIGHFSCGTKGAPLADVEFDARGLADDAPTTLVGALRDVFHRKYRSGSIKPEPMPVTTAVEAFSTDGGTLVDSLVQQLELGDANVDAHGIPLAATIEGPLDNPIFYLAADGLTLDVLSEPAWIMRDVVVGGSLTRAVVPPQWQDWVEMDIPHYIFQIDTFEGQGLGGTFALDPPPPGGQVVFPESETAEPWMLSGQFDVKSVNPALLVPDSPDLAPTLAGTISGAVELERLLLRAGSSDDPLDASATTPLEEQESPVQRVELVFRGIDVVRDRGPEDDGVPRRIGISGPLVLDERNVLASREMNVTVDGGSLAVRGGLELSSERLRPTEISLDVEDGPRFLAAFGLDPYFDHGHAAITVQGPLVALDASTGELSVTGLGLGRLGTADVTQARLAMKAGTLNLRSSEAEMFGGRGSIDLDLVLSDGRRFLDDPRVRATVETRNVDLQRVVGDDVAGRADVSLEIGDEEGKPARFADIRVRGNAQAPILKYGGTTYGKARAQFELTPERLRIDQLILPVHRSISPFHAPDVTVPIGAIKAEGTITLEEDPGLDLKVSAAGVPIDVVARLLETELPVRGQIARGTSFHAGGSASRPSIEGSVRLSGLDVYGMALGSGTIEVASSDVDATDPLAAHRELRAQGEFTSPGGSDSKGVDWTMDAIVAVGRSNDDGRPPVAAQARLYFDQIALKQVFSAAQLADMGARVEGRLEGITAQALTCNPGTPMLSDCVGNPAPEQSFALDLELERFWLRDRTSRKLAGDPCAVGTTLCSRNTLRARVDWPVVRLLDPWSFGGGRVGPSLEMRGLFDLSTPAEKDEQACRRTGFSPTPIEGQGDAQIGGSIELIALGPLFRLMGARPRDGTLNVALDVDGLLLDPRVGGQIELPTGASPIQIVIDQPPVAVTLDGLDMEIIDGRLYAETRLAAKGATLQIGTVGRQRTYYTLSGPCQGEFSVAAQGALTGELIEAALPEGTASIKGSARIPQFAVAGRVGAQNPIRRLTGTVEFGAEHALQIETALGIERIETRGGRIELQMCASDRPCPGGRRDGAFALYLGGRAGATATRAPQSALDFDVGNRGRAQIWGQLFVPPSVDRFEDARVYVNLDDVFYRDFDARGHPRLEASVSTTGLTLEGGNPVAIHGTVDIEHSRWLKDALEGTNVIRLTEEVDAVRAPPPEIIRTMEFDLDFRTTTPLRIDNNIATNVEAGVRARVTGTYENPTVQGRLDVEPGGLVQLPFIKGEFEIQEGKVLVDRVIANAEVDVLAVRVDPRSTQNSTSKYLAVHLFGPLTSIGWECDTGSSGSRTLDSRRACIEQLVFGSQEPVATTVEAQRPGGSAGSLYPRKGLQVISNVAVFDVSEQLLETTPGLEGYIPDVQLQLGQVGPELVIDTPRGWFDFSYGYVNIGLRYTRGYPGFLLRQSVEYYADWHLLDPFSLQLRHSDRSYLNERIIFDPLTQRSIEAGFEFEIPSLR